MEKQQNNLLDQINFMKSQIDEIKNYTHHKVSNEKYEQLLKKIDIDIENTKIQIDIEQKKKQQYWVILKISRMKYPRINIRNRNIKMK